MRLIVFAAIVVAHAVAGQSADAAPFGFGPQESRPSDKAFRFIPGMPRSPDPKISLDQALRPRFHFTARANWLNDPNGLVFDGKRHHLFFQTNPLGTDWGSMSWGHATSTDMVHWRETDRALLPYEVDGRRATIFSGSAVVDHRNDLGKQEGDRKTLVAFFTSAADRGKFHQSMAYSTDGGERWTYWDDGRAIVRNQGFDDGERDPKVFWHAPSERWVMVLWVRQNPGRVRFFNSKNLRDWDVVSDLDRDWAFECMDLFPLAVDGDPARMKWILTDASFDYEIGSFDGKTFTTEAGPFRAGHGDFYAAQTFNDLPEKRIVGIGWMRGGPNSARTYGLPFNQQMSFPYDLSLRQTPSGVRLAATPIREIDSLVVATRTAKEKTLAPNADLFGLLPALVVGPTDVFDLSIDVDLSHADSFALDMPTFSLRFDTAKGEMTQTGADDAGRAKMVTTFAEALQPVNGRLRLRLLADRLSIESFTADGTVFAAHYLAPLAAPLRPSFTVAGGSATVHEFTIRTLRSAW